MAGELKLVNTQAGHQVCSTCGEEKPLSDYRMRRGRPEMQCKSCQHRRTRDWIKRNPERFRERRKRYEAENEDRIRQYKRGHYRETYVERMLYAASKRAIKHGVPFDLTSEDIFIPEFCPVLGIRLEIGNGGKGHGFNPNSPNLDRIVPALGYVRGNVAVISGRANLIKRDATAEELERVAAWMRAQGSR